MKHLFKRCLNADYKHTENGGDYSIEIQDKTLYLLFQWSKGKEDWKNNFRFPAKAYKKGDNRWYCHGGFKRVWKSISAMLVPRVLAALQTHTEIDTIVCVGFSHGGPMAGFATEDMEFRYGSAYKIEGYAFGCPRFVFGILPRAVKNRFKHFTVIRNIPDIVTHVPPIVLGFRHVGKLIKIGSVINYIASSLPSFLQNCVNAHRSENYIKELEKTK